MSRPYWQLAPCRVTESRKEARYWVVNRRWFLDFERQLSPKETLTKAGQEAIFGQFLSFRRKPESSSIFLDPAVKPLDDRF